ncbi:anti-sigma factor [Pedobacter sp. KBW01]|nr:anti-sigma factor [Pedobacter sp. KBW01]
MNMEESTFKELLQKYQDGKCTPEELNILESWYLAEAGKPIPAYSEAELYGIKTAVWDEFSKKAGFRAQDFSPESKTIKLFRNLGIAAALIVAVGIGFYFYSTQNAKDNRLVNKQTTPVIPGSNRALLTLADGTKVALDDSKNGELAQKSGIQIVKLADGQLLYRIPKSTQKTGLEHLSNTIQTPNGGQYQLILEDGTKVWLNAASSLRYPMAFSSHDRVVELEGEAYFEVAKDKKRRFVVKTIQQEVAVLGTHFNINAYPEESSVKTTLFEGSVRVTEKNKGTGATVLLKPGQASQFNGGQFDVKEVDTEEAVAWKNGYFVFDNEDLKTAVRKVARWYNLEVVYTGQFGAVEIGGSVSRFDNIDQVLQVLRLTTRLNFKVEGRRLIISH